MESKPQSHPNKRYTLAARARQRWLRPWSSELLLVCFESVLAFLHITSNFSCLCVNVNLTEWLYSCVARPHWVSLKAVALFDILPVTELSSFGKTGIPFSAVRAISTVIVPLATRVRALSTC